MGIETGVDVFKLMDVAEDLVVPMMDHPIRIDRDALILGYAGVYSSFLLFAKRAGAKYGVPSADILVELGRMKTVGGQEDMIEDLALNMARDAQARLTLSGAPGRGPSIRGFATICTRRWRSFRRPSSSAPPWPARLYSAVPGAVLAPPSMRHATCACPGRRGTCRCGSIARPRRASCR